MKLLLAVDGSEPALAAVRWVVAHLADWRSAPELDLLTVQPAVASGLVRRFLSQQVVDDYLREEGMAALAAAQAILAKAGMAAAIHVGVGDAAPTIVAHAQQLGADVIVLGTRGAGALRTALLGSTARRVLELSDRPVWVVP